MSRLGHSTPRFAIDGMPGRSSLPLHPLGKAMPSE